MEENPIDLVKSIMTSAAKAKIDPYWRQVALEFERYSNGELAWALAVQLEAWPV